MLRDDAVVGVVTRSDVFRRPDEDQLALIMSRDPHVVAPDATIREAALLMADRKIGCLPVVRDGRLVGIVTERDFVTISGQLLDAVLRN